MEGNIRHYIRYFKLIKTSHNEFSNTSGISILKIKGKDILIKSSLNKWEKYKHGDLIVSIINNIPLHI